MKINKKVLFIKLVYVIIITALATGVSLLLGKMGIGKENALMVFLVGVLAVTVLTNGYVYSIVAAFFSVLLFNFFFTPPLGTLLINNTDDVILLFFFLIVALIAGSLTSKFQKQAKLARQRERMTKLLFEVNEGFLNVTGEENAINLALFYIYKHTGCHCSVFINEGEKTYYDKEVQEPSQLACFNKFLELPIKRAGKDLGLVKIYEDDKKLTIDSSHIAKSITSQLALILDREFIYKERESIKIAMESEHIKSNLLRAISHDLRTPLTAIVGASGLLAEGDEVLDFESVKKLAVDINEEALWLTQLVENILNMTRIEEGKLIINKSVEVVDDVVNEALSHVPGLTAANRLTTYLPDNLISFPMDGTLIVQVLTNLIDNAVKHTNGDVNIVLRVYTEDTNAIFEVQDDGPGIDRDIRDTLFDGFVKASIGKSTDSSRGMGLGLAICKAIVDAHKGTISYETPVNGGALFRFTLPMREGEGIDGK